MSAIRILALIGDRPRPTPLPTPPSFVFVALTERSFSSEQPTTLNPLAFINPPRTTSNPIEQQLVNEQRQFQQEIADRGLREQQQRSFGLPQPPAPPPNPNNQFIFQSSSFSNADPSDPNGQFDDQSNAFLNQPSQSNLFLNQPSSNAEDQFAFQNSFADQGDPVSETAQQFDQQFPTSFSQSPAQSSSNVRAFRRKRAIVRQQSSLNDLNFYPSTVRPQSFVDNFLNEQSNPRSDLAQIGSWLIGNLAKQLEKNLAHLTESTAKPKLQYSTPSIISTEPPSNLIPVGYQPDVKVETRHIPWSTVQPTPDSTVSPIPWNQPTFVPYTETAKPDWNLVTSTLPPNTRLWTAAPQPSTTTDYPKIRNVQILPTSAPGENGAINPYDNSVFQAYQQIYNVDHQSTRPVESTTAFLQPVNSPSTSEATITSLFKSKLNTYKQAEVQQPSLLQHGYTDFQQPNRFFDLLQQPNATILPVIDSNSSMQSVDGNANPGSAIFIKMPDDEPTSTVGYLFDKTISAKSLQKKENYVPKKKDRSAQIIKSSLVYRTPPGKRATVSRSELLKNNQNEATLLSNFIEPGRAIPWLLGQTRPTTTTRPLVTALWNLIQKRSPFNLQ